ncbi:DHA2 family efflux MFS transporter permease subunit [Polymorphospora rubra]|uniref:MFS transporter n=1 Tax=Polymorphospora rubra TaxID=338584 RepID=A0A810MSM7_9ACTN|nr:DHA2 family efflux MFS transporter permease subunit [Polymorphospora rubra]BCJ64236.1 MFS transporter [Polymorphospora rubra]
MSGPTMPAARRWLALGVLCSGTLLVILDGSVVTVALPIIQHDLGFSRSGLAWVVNAYLIAFAGLLLLAGRLGDLIGRKRVLLAGLAVFTVASLLCGVAGSSGELIAARFAQGVGGAMASAVVLGMIVTMFPEPGERARAIGVYSLVQASGAAIGLIAGGVLTQLLSWHWAFFVNVPVGIAAVLLAYRLFPAERGPGLRAGLDLPGAALVTGGLMLLVYAIVEAERHSWGSPRTAGPAVLSIVLLAGFVIRQATARQPLLPLRIFRSRAVSGANLVMLPLVAGMFGFQFLTALYLQRLLDLDALRTGLAFLPAPAAIALVSVGVAGRLAARFGPRTVLVAGLTAIAAGLLLLARVPADARYAVDVLPALVLIGAAFGAVLPALMGQAMSAATPADSGLASGLVNTTQQVGAAIGTAVLAALASARTGALLAQGAGSAAALAGGFRVAYAASAAFALAGVVAAVLVLRRPAKLPAGRPVDA